MPNTSISASVTFTDVTALSEASVGMSEATKKDVDLFRYENDSKKEYGTLEKNIFVLDGSKDIYDNEDDIAFWSVPSREDCTFSVNPYFDATFTTLHSTAGLTLYFQDDYPSEIKVHYYSAKGTRINSESFIPTSTIFVCPQPVEKYGKIRIEFVKTRLPQSYIKLRYVLYGVLVSWGDEVISEASLHEEIDVTSSQLAINTATLSVVDETGDYDVQNPDGMWRFIQKTQRVRLIETKDGEDIECGTFYISDHKEKNNIVSFDLVDAIGVMANYVFRDGEIYVNRRAEDILDSIFALCGVPYAIEDELKDIPLTGHLKKMTCREALQMVCFCIGAVADCSRGDAVIIQKPKRYVSSIIGLDRKFFGNTSVELGEYVSGITIEVERYVKDTQRNDVYQDILPQGDNLIEFSSPIDASTLQTNVGTFKVKKTNYCVISMPREAEVNISAVRYNAETFALAKNVDSLDSGEIENVKTYSGITLYNTHKMNEKIQSLFNHYALRKTLNIKYLLDKEKVGDWVSVRDMNDNISTTLVLSQDINLSGGFISEARCVGYTQIMTDFAYTGEIYAGEEVLF